MLAWSTCQDLTARAKIPETEVVKMNRFLMIVAFIVMLVPVVLGQDRSKTGHQDMAAMLSIYATADVKWKDGPASFRPGAKMAVLEGDPTKEGVFTMRVWLPDGFSIQPHFHSNVEHVTVISGTFNVGMGEKFDKSASREMKKGTFGFWPAGMRHFAWVKGDTILQLHGVGPWTITYVNSAEDPRNAGKKP